MAITVPAVQQIQAQITDQAGQWTPQARDYFTRENTALVTMAQTLNAQLGVNRLTLAQAQALSLGVSDAGYVAYVTDYAHLIVWDGTAWVFMDGGGGYFQDFPVDPQGNGWQLCDGTATTYLTVGVTLNAVAFTTPDLTGGAYRKGTGSGSYSGTVNAATAPGASMSGSTATGTTGTGTTGVESGDTSVPWGNVGFNVNVVSVNHTHSIPGLSIPALGAGTLAATVDATGEPKNLAAPVYFRR